MPGAIVRCSECRMVAGVLARIRVGDQQVEGRVIPSAHHQVAGMAGGIGCAALGNPPAIRRAMALKRSAPAGRAHW